MKGTLIFIAGVIVGSVATWKIIEKRYKDLADDEIKSVKDMFLKKNKKIKKTENENNNDLDQSDDIVEIRNGQIVNYAGIIKKEEYDSEENDETDDETDDDLTINHDNFGEENISPYVIEPEEFATIDSYGTKTLTYWADDVLTDEIDHIINNRDDLIGTDALDHFGEYEDDAVHIRDVVNEMDYEIIKSEKKFSEIMIRGND